MADIPAEFVEFDPADIERRQRVERAKNDFDFFAGLIWVIILLIRRRLTIGY